MRAEPVVAGNVLAPERRKSTNPFDDDDDVNSNRRAATSRGPQEPSPIVPTAVANNSKSSNYGHSRTSKEEFSSSSEELPALPMKNENRKCTDAFFIVLLCIAWMLMTAAGMQLLGVYKPVWLHEGDPERLLRGIDYKGHLCGVGEFEDSNNIWFPNLDGNNYNSQNVLVPVGFGICVANCPMKLSVVTDPYGEYGTWTNPSECVNIVSRCMPLDAKKSNQLFSAAIVFSDLLETYSLIAMFGFVLAIVLSILFLVTIRIPCILRASVWLCVCAVFFILTVGCYSILQVADDQEHEPDASSRQSVSELALLKSLGYLLGIFAVFWASFILLMREKIALAIGIVRESASALTDMPLLMLFPFFQLIIFAGFTAIWILYSVYLASSGELVVVKDEVTGIQMRVFEYDKNAQAVLLGLVFVWFWTIAFIEAVGSLVFSHAIVAWYFAPDDNTGSAAQVPNPRKESIDQISGFSDLHSNDRISHFGGDLINTSFKNDRGESYKFLTGSEIVWNAIATVFRFHLGTAALGSFAIATLRTVRLVVYYARLKLTSKPKGNSISISPTQQISSRIPCCSALCHYILSCIDCLLACVDTCVRYVNKHAYTQVSMFGDPFCKAARRGFSMLRKNFGRIATVHVIGDFVVLVGKISISLTSAALAYIYIMQYNTFLKENLHGYVIPILFVAFVAFFTATMVLGMLSIVCDSIMQSFIIDEALSKSNNEDLESLSAGGPSFPSSKRYSNTLHLQSFRYEQVPNVLSRGDGANRPSGLPQLDIPDTSQAVASFEDDDDFAGYLNDLKKLPKYRLDKHGAISVANLTSSVEMSEIHK